MAGRPRAAGRAVAPGGRARGRGASPRPGPVALGQAVLADIIGGDDDVLTHLDAIEPGVLDDAGSDGRLAARHHPGRAGRAEESIAVFDAIPPIPDPAFQLNFEGARLEARWALGQVDEVIAAVPSITDGLEAAGVLQFVLVSLAEPAFVLAWVGDVGAAQRLVAGSSDRGGR